VQNVQPVIRAPAVWAGCAAQNKSAAVLCAEQGVFYATTCAELGRPEWQAWVPPIGQTGLVAPWVHDQCLRTQASYDGTMYLAGLVSYTFERASKH